MTSSEPENWGEFRKKVKISKAPPEHELKFPEEVKQEKKEKQPVLVRMDTIDEEMVYWLWHPFIPRKKVTLIEGDPEAGKTWFALNIAAQLSHGYTLPDTDGKFDKTPSIPRKTLYLTCEDGLADTIKPRLRLCGALQQHITCYQANTDGTGFTFDDMNLLEDAIVDSQADFVVLDPLQGYLGQVDMNNAAEVRPLMTKLYMVAEKHDVAIACIRHCRKVKGDKAIHKGLGSIDFSAQARSIIYIAQNPENKEERVIFHSKSSLSKHGSNLGYKITDEGLFEWTGVSEYSAEDLEVKRGPKSRPVMNRTEEFLKNLLAPLGPEGMTAVNVERKAKLKGFSWNTIRSMSNKLPIKKVRSGFGGESLSTWIWINNEV